MRHLNILKCAFQTIEPFLDHANTGQLGVLTSQDSQENMSIPVTLIDCAGIVPTPLRVNRLASGGRDPVSSLHCIWEGLKVGWG